MNINRQFLWVAFIGIGFFFTSCNNTETIEAEAVEVAETTNETTYKYDNSTTEIGFTAFKFLNKTGVGGAFDEFEMTVGVEEGNAKEIIEGLSVAIPITGLNTKDESRDGKISNFFFGTINTDVIEGRVIGLYDNGTANFEFTMNGVTNEIEGDYTLEGGNFNFTAEIDVNDWNAEAGIEALNEECHDLHIDYENGDTESKLWSEVSINFSTQLEEIIK
ncbi:MAG: YceI family protein [Brumimicrobium sp.]